MLLDDLVGVIELLKERIATHGDFLRQNEIRTRTALIDPLLAALGWNVADPSAVRPEYNAGNGRADYGLMGANGQLVASIEAKRYGESLENHEKQIFDYAWNLQVKYAGLTDGNRWYFLDFSKFTDSDRTVLQMSLANTPAHEAALKLLLLWRPNLASGQPVAANAPMTGLPTVPETPATADYAPPSVAAEFSPADVSVPASQPFPQAAAPQPSAPNEPGWQRLNAISYQVGDAKPIAVRFDRTAPKTIRNWISVWFETCQWLDGMGRLTSDFYAFPKSKNHLVNKTGQHPSGKKFHVQRTIRSGLFVECNYNPQNALKNSLFLLRETGVDPEAVELRFG